MGNEVKVEVDPLTITLSGPLGKFVIPIPATLGSVRSEILTLRRWTHFLKDTESVSLNLELQEIHRDTSWCFYVRKWVIATTIAWRGHKGSDLSWMKVCVIPMSKQPRPAEVLVKNELSLEGWEGRR